MSFYLAVKVSAHWEMLREAAYRRQQQEVKDLRKRAEQKYPKGEEKRERTMWFYLELSRLGIPEYPLRPTGGVIGRMAIDYVGRRGVDRIVGDAAKYAADVHEQPHRARRDLHKRTR